jgi:elongation factor P--(R)-beta-lysine ligase
LTGPGQRDSPEVPWQPGVEPETLAKRARLVACVRAFFEQRSVMEVTTPVLGAAGVTDVHIRSVAVTEDGKRYYLQTSPEYAMKRLLASGSGPIFQICPAFRGGELGRRHNIEFTLLEWYRPGFSLAQLADEVDALVVAVTGALGGNTAVRRSRYKDLFGGRFGVNPHTIGSRELAAIAAANFGEQVRHIDDFDDDGARNDYLDLLFSEGIEKAVVEPTIVFDYPASQAALAETGPDSDGDQIARRFEILWQGVEVGNGYEELRDAHGLRRRMELNNTLRAVRGLPSVPLDEKLLAALPYMPACSGVAVGLDRILMLLLGKPALADVTGFFGDRL